jgi:hypothetical protein
MIVFIKLKLGWASMSNSWPGPPNNGPLSNDLFVYSYTNQRKQMILFHCNHIVYLFQKLFEIARLTITVILLILVQNSLSNNAFFLNFRCPKQNERKYQKLMHFGCKFSHYLLSYSIIGALQMFVLFRKSNLQCTSDYTSNTNFHRCRQIKFKVHMLSL